MNFQSKNNFSILLHHQVAAGLTPGVQAHPTQVLKYKSSISSKSLVLLQTNVNQFLNQSNIPLQQTSVSLWSLSFVPLIFFHLGSVFNTARRHTVSFTDIQNPHSWDELISRTDSGPTNNCWLLGIVWARNPFFFQP